MSRRSESWTVGWWHWRCRAELLHVSGYILYGRECGAQMDFQRVLEDLGVSGQERVGVGIPCPEAQGMRGGMRCMEVRCCALQSHGREEAGNGIRDTMAFQKAAYHVRWRAGADPHVMGIQYRIRMGGRGSKALLACSLHTASTDRASTFC